MSEVEKMYENCNIKPKQKGYCDWDSNCPYPHHKCNDKCPYWKYEDEAKYPPFTAEKQLELIKWLAFRDYIAIVAYISGEYHIEHDKYNADENSLEGCLTRLVNNLWQDLTDAREAADKGDIRIMEGFVIEYLSDLLGNIKFFSGFIVLFAGTFFYLACLFQDEYSEKVYKLEKKYLVIIILACVFALFLPSRLKYNYVNHYIEENRELRKQVNEMNFLIQKGELQQQQWLESEVRE